MTIFFLLGFVIPGIFVFLATSTPDNYKCPDGHEAKVGYSGYGMCMECGWLEDEDDL